MWEHNIGGIKIPVESFTSFTSGFDNTLYQIQAQIL